MIFINEWLPNPIGNDKNSEWIELKNEGYLAVDLNNWFIKTKNGTKFLFPRKIIKPGEFLILKKEETKLTLRNTDEKIFLYNNKNQLIDESEFFGTAPEGKSFSRQGENFFWSVPTPGYHNQIIFSNITNKIYPHNKALNLKLSLIDFLGMFLVGSAIITFFIIFALKNNDYLSNIFFSRD